MKKESVFTGKGEKEMDENTVFHPYVNGPVDGFDCSLLVSARISTQPNTQRELDLLLESFRVYCVCIEDFIKENIGREIKLINQEVRNGPSK